MTRTLLITTTAPYPKNVGKRVVLGGLCDYFSGQRADGDFKVLSFDRLPDGLNTTGDGLLPKPRVGRKLWNLLWHTGIRGDKSMQESLFWSPAAQRQIDATIADYRPEVVVFDTVRVGQYHGGNGLHGFRAVLYLDDLFSVRYARILETIARFPGVTIDAMGNFAGNVPRCLLALYHRVPQLQRWLLKHEQMLICRSENTQPGRFDLALLINAGEAEHLQQRAQLDNVRALRPYMPMPLHASPRTWAGQPTFVFLGSLNLPHNAVSIELFIEAQLPRLIRLIPRVRLIVIGAHASPALRALAARHARHLTLAGFVHEVAPTLSSCAGMIAPLLFGSGVKIKVLDALRLGVPVIATPFGSEGIVTDDENGLIIEESLDAFPAHCERLLDPAVNAAQSRASDRLFQKHYAPSAVSRQYDEFFGASASPEAPSPP